MLDPACPEAFAPAPLLPVAGRGLPVPASEAPEVECDMGDPGASRAPDAPPPPPPPASALEEAERWRGEEVEEPRAEPGEENISPAAFICVALAAKV